MENISPKCLDVTRHGLIHYALFTEAIYDGGGRVKISPDAADAAELIRDLANDYSEFGYISKEKAGEFNSKAEELEQAIKKREITKASELAVEVEHAAQDIIGTAVVKCEVPKP